MKRSKDEMAERVTELLRLVKLEGLGNRFPNQISGGQRQRVALARALAVDPKVLLLDEPFGALDANVRRDLRRWLREIHEELGITTLFVTHDQEEALDLADRVVILNEGKIVQQGTPEEVCRNPNSAFVMNFLGDANRIGAAVVNGKAALGGAELEAANFSDGPASVYLRPRDLDWSATEPGIAATVTRVIDRPDGRRILARTAGGERDRARRRARDRGAPRRAGFRAHPPRPRIRGIRAEIKHDLEPKDRDSEKFEAVFGQDHAQTNGLSGMTT